MRVQHNIMAMNAYRNYTNNTNALAKNIEKLSSGYRINRAGDDAAGLAISEKMRAQIAGLTQAQKNAKDGISLVQTAEGAMQEVHDMLRRMTTLATQSANGTYDNEVDRANLQKEVTALKSEIDRIADSSNFNGINLLDGSLAKSGSAAIASAVNIGNVLTTNTVASKGIYTTSAIEAGDSITNMSDGDKLSYTFTYKDSADGSSKTLNMSFTVTFDQDSAKYYLVSDKTGKRTEIDDITTEVAISEAAEALQYELQNSGLSNLFDITVAPAGTMSFTAREFGSDGAVLLGLTEERTINGTTTIVGTDMVTKTPGSGADSYKQITNTDFTMFDPNDANLEDAIFTINGQKFVFALATTETNMLSKDITVLRAATGPVITAAIADTIAQKTGLNVDWTASTLTFKPGNGTNATGGLTLQIGDTADNFNKLNVSIEDMHTKALGIASLDISTQDGAANAIDIIKNAINLVSDNRGTLGALQNRLEHTINNLSVMTENLQDAESTIRDTDVAEEMMAYTKNSILVQSSQAMLAQANQIPQGVLQLLG